jgi:DNA-binding transcriptional LysR family regulator
MDMNLQQLRYLVAAADHGSLSGAARQLEVSQPVVSRALHGLEREYGISVFEQTGRCLTMTAAGHVVVQQARRALNACDEVERTARRIALGAELVIVATPTNSALLSPIVTAFVSCRPTTALHLRRAASVEDVLAMITTGEAELGFVDLSQGIDFTTVVARPIWSAEVVLVSPVGTDLPPVVRMDGLANARLVLPQEGTKRRRMIDSALASAAGRAPLAALATDERSAWVASAQQGIGSFFSYRAVAAELDGVELRPIDPPKRTEVGFVYPRETVSEEGQEMMRLAAEGPLPRGCRRPSGG